mmetsp:Transcript_2074/g.7482  ORF Transcript_2074/g.7482 Transcript_2074/m.7482 type:complete len:101 (+) Transcript_2074:1210-1512(+)
MNPFGINVQPMQAQLKSAHDATFRPDISKIENSLYAEFSWLIQACWSGDAKASDQTLPHSSSTFQRTPKQVLTRCGGYPLAGRLDIFLSINHHRHVSTFV